VAKVEKAE
jgi:hypothetical protein